MATDWLLWQLADSAFPSGGFAHSAGMEAVRGWGMLADGKSLLDFLQASLVQMGQGAIPLVTAANRNPELVAELDRTCDAFLSNRIANRSSRAQGQGFLAAACAAFRAERLADLRSRVRDGRLLGHNSPIFGAVTGALGIEPLEGSRLFLHIGLRGLISSAVRLNVVGPFEGQAIQHHLGPFLEHLARASSQLEMEDLSQTAPVLDILQGTHDRLYSRLFQS